MASGLIGRFLPQRITAAAAAAKHRT
ncbi:BnaCnng16220D [Brassica napus]|uniref:BnaCnng16220D protein n=1 Tax=Brassica napus TaxID=3708 RepID=A0A078IBV6_BRANA|nr:BnaCnng16220D [Brassica napus]